MMEYSHTFINFITSVLILIIGLIIGKATSNILKKLFIGINSTFFKKYKNKGLELTIATLTKWAIYIFTIILALLQVGIEQSIIKFVILTILILAILFILLTFKDWIPNLAAGLNLRKTKKLKVGKTIIFKDLIGKIIDFNILETKIKTNRGEEIYIPNNLLTKEKFIIK
jgi:small-conductance mechanosensitive channel